MLDEISRQFEEIRLFRKFEDLDSRFIAQRKEFANNIGEPELYRYIDQFGLYAGSQTLASRLATYDILRKCIDVPGHIVEFGVWHGANIMFMAKVLQILRPNSLKKLYGFDNFSGLSDFHEFDGGGAKSNDGKYKGNEQVLRAAIDLFEMNNWVHLIKGDARTTIPMFAEEFPEFIVSMAWIDFDLYEPCRVALEFLAKRLSVGGIIVFDEAIDASWPGETRAMLEFLEDAAGTHFEMHDTDIARQPVMYLQKK
jgi:hypothetical protein